MGGTLQYERIWTGCDFLLGRVRHVRDNAIWLTDDFVFIDNSEREQILRDILIYHSKEY